MSLAPHQPKINVDNISDDEGNTVPISPVATCSKPDYKEWDLPSESDDSSQTSDGRLNHIAVKGVFFVFVNLLNMIVSAFKHFLSRKIFCLK